MTTKSATVTLGEPTVNYVPALSTVCCCGCGDECRAEQLNENGHCRACRVDLRMAVENERARDFQSLAHEALVARVVERARSRAALLLPTTYSNQSGSPARVSPSLVQLLTQAIREGHRRTASNTAQRR